MFVVCFLGSLVVGGTAVPPVWRIGLAILTCVLACGLAAAFSGPLRLPLLCAAGFSLLQAILPLAQQIDAWLGGAFTLLLFSSFAALVWRGRIAAGQLLVRERSRAGIDAADAVKSQLAHDLHDDYLRPLTEGRQLLSAARLAPTSPETMTLVERADDLFFAQATKLRDLVNDLHPAVLDRLGLAGALADLASDTEIEYPGKTVSTFVSAGERPEWTQDRTLRLGLFRIAQEAVAAAVEHSGADRVQVAVRADETRVELTINDNGNGSETAIGRRALASMRNRCTALSGDFSFEATPGIGSLVSARIPLRERTRRSEVAVSRPSVMAVIPRHRRPDPYGLSPTSADHVDPPVALP
ncbi:sensor histidine kinase [Fodinicola acaciae]|uniref:sensor histidine kinase n=1 Tax=Fodinicola acaciae TaxID=2681555 RepID=UPI0013D7C89F|nr:ATP-binding protein [Fodinicola acaciae]